MLGSDRSNLKYSQKTIFFFSVKSSNFIMKNGTFDYFYFVFFSVYMYILEC